MFNNTEVTENCIHKLYSCIKFVKRLTVLTVYKSLANHEGLLLSSCNYKKKEQSLSHQNNLQCKF